MSVQVKKTHKSNRVLLRFSKSLRAYFKVASVVVSSCARLGGLNEGTVAPKNSAFLAISSESVVTNI